MRLYWVTPGPDPKAGVIVKEEEIGYICTHRRKVFGDRGRDWSHAILSFSAAGSRGMPRADDSHVNMETDLTQ
jgi:hypothetical protein